MMGSKIIRGLHKDADLLAVEEEFLLRSEMTFLLLRDSLF